MARIKKNFKLKPVLFIACEGTSSEYQYFQSWAETDEVSLIYNRVIVYPDESEDRPKTTPYQLFEIAREVLENGSADFAWIVFDHDNHPRIEQTFTEAATAGVKIAFSSRSFEEWVLLHFEKNITIFNATECKDVKDKPIICGSVYVPDCAPVNCLSGHIRRQNFIPDYSKSKSFDLYSAISKRTEIAIVNAAWLRLKTNSSLNRPRLAINKLNPYTDTDQLILNLLERPDKTEWGIKGENISLGGWFLYVTMENRYIVITLLHRFNQAIVLNASFTESSFFTTNDALNENHCFLISHKYVLNAKGSTFPLLYAGDEIEFTFQADFQPYFLFKDLNRGIRIFVEL